MFNKFYKINLNEFQKIYRLSEEIHGNLGIIQMFCEKYKDVDEFYKIIPIIKHTNRLTDKLYAEFINIR